MRKSLKLILVFAFLFYGRTFAQEVKDLIKTVNLIAGHEDSVLVSDMFFAKKYDIKVAPNKYVGIKFNKKTNYLHFKAPANFEGYTIEEIYNGDDTLDFPVFVKFRQKHTFKFKPKKKFKELTLFGDFNGWKRHTLPLKDNDGDGIYTVSVELDPGTYQYKFYLDSLELVDPANPDSVANGLGGFNSVIKIPEIKKPFTFLHAEKFREENGKAIFSFYYEQRGEHQYAQQQNIIALLNNKKIDKRFLKINKDQIIFALPLNLLKGKKIVRLAVTKNKVSTNLQEVYLYNGKPFGIDSPFDWHEGIIYSMLIDRFCDGDKSNDKPIVQDSLSPKANYMGGDIAGIIKKLDNGYFDSLGVNVIWISPVNDNPNKAYREYPKPHRWFTGYHGYWPISAYRVEEHFGNMKLLKEFVAKLHAHGIKVLLDFVSHHVHEEHPYYKNHKEWFGDVHLPDGSLNIRIWDEHRLTTWFDTFLPTFNYLGSKVAVDTMTANALWWLKETGADGFRHDAVKHVPNLFWRTLTRKIKSNFNRHYYQIGETFGNYKLVSSYVNNGQLDAQFNFNLYNIAQAVFIDSSRSFEDLREELKKTRYYYGPLPLMGNIMDSHDKNRYIAYADGDIPLWQWDATEMGWKNPPHVDHPSSYKKAELYYAYMFTVPGIPVIYYGSEFGMTGASDPDNRRMMRFGKQLNKYERGMLKDVRKMVNLRRKHSALNFGDIYFLAADTSVFAFTRSDFNEHILVVLNKTPVTRKVDLRLPEFYDAVFAEDLLNGEKIPFERNSISVVVPAYGYRFLKIEQ